MITSNLGCQTPGDGGDGELNAENMAADYVLHGLALVAIPYGKKGPNAVGWNLCENAITRAEQTIELTGNIGLAHAYCHPNPTMALDIDDMTLAKPWLADRGVDLEGLLAAPDAVQVLSGREGRGKLLYRLPHGTPAMQTVQIKAPTGGSTILEFRCASRDGKTVQDVLPPSIHPDTGQPYLWGGQGDWQAIPPIPAILIAVWLDELAPLKPQATTATDKSVEATAKEELGPITVKHLRSALLSMRADDRGLWAKMGMALKPYGDIGRGLWMEWSQTSEKSLQGGGPLALSRTWDSFKPTKIGYQAVFADAQRQGWVNPAKNLGGTQVSGEPDEDWPSPCALPNRLRDVIPLDTSCLPSAIRGAAVDIAERLSCPLEYVATPLLVGAGAIMGNRIAILPKQFDDSWKVFPTLWGGIVGPPGTMKTPAQTEAFKPLQHIEEQEHQTYAIAAAQYAVDLKTFEKGLLAFKNGKTAAQPTEPTAPKKPRLIVNDTTYQALGEILAANQHGVLIHGDELSGLLQSLDAPGQEAARGFYLTGWGGAGNYTFDRIGRGTIRLKGYALSVFGGFQPDKIKHYVRAAQSGSAQNDGLLQRFQLLVWPDFAAEPVVVDRAPDRAALAEMNRALLALRPVRTETSPTQHLHFDADAQVLFNQWLVKIERLVRRGQAGAAEQSHFAKYRSLIPALALLFHRIDGHGGPVCLGCLESALSYGVHLRSHARRVYGAVNATDSAPIHALAEKLVQRALSSGFTARAVYTKEWQDLSDKDRVFGALGHLVELNWLRERVVETRGRKTTAYEINPQLPASSP